MGGILQTIFGGAGQTAQAVGQSGLGQAGATASSALGQAGGLGMGGAAATPAMSVAGQAGQAATGLEGFISATMGDFQMLGDLLKGDSKSGGGGAMPGAGGGTPTGAGVPAPASQGQMLAPGGSTQLKSGPQSRPTFMQTMFGDALTQWKPQNAVQVPLRASGDAGGIGKALNRGSATAAARNQTAGTSAFPAMPPHAVDTLGIDWSTIGKPQQAGGGGGALSYSPNGDITMGGAAPENVSAFTDLLRAQQQLAEAQAGAIPTGWEQFGQTAMKEVGSRIGQRAGGAGGPIQPTAAIQQGPGGPSLIELLNMLLGGGGNGGPR